MLLPESSLNVALNVIWRSWLTLNQQEEGKQVRLPIKRRYGVELLRSSKEEVCKEAIDG